MKTFIKPNNSIIIAGDKYNDTPQINQSFDDTVGDIKIREKSIFESVTENSTLHDKTLYPQENSEKLLKTSHPTENFNFSNQPVIGNYYNSLEDFISKLTKMYSPSRTIYHLQGDLGGIYMWENESVLFYAIRIQEIAAENLECH